MEHITIRKARTADLDTLLRFEQGVIIAERPFDSTLKDDPLHYYDIPYMIDADHIELLVAEEGNALIGCGYARIESPGKHYLKHSLHGYPGFMYTDPNHRGKSVNKLIIEVLKQWCISKNITELRLDVYHDNQPAIKAYEKVGFKRHMIEMRSDNGEMS